MVNYDCNVRPGVRGEISSNSKEDIRVVRVKHSS